MPSKHTEATKRKIRLSQLGKKNSFFGHTHSKSTRNSWSSKRKGKKNPMFGKKHSPSAIAKMRAAALKRAKGK